MLWTFWYSLISRHFKIKYFYKTFDIYRILIRKKHCEPFRLRIHPTNPLPLHVVPFSLFFSFQLLALHLQSSDVYLNTLHIVPRLRIFTLTTHGVLLIFLHMLILEFATFGVFSRMHPSMPLVLIIRQ